MKTIELSKETDLWNSLILDSWIDGGRLIANIQNTDEAVGMDRGYRVALHFEEYEEILDKALERGIGYESKAFNLGKEIKSLVLEALDHEPFKLKILEISKNNPFVIEICDYGERIGIKIPAEKL